MRKAQIVGQVFIYVLAAIVFSIILLFGYKAISGFMDRGSEVALLDLKQEVQSAIRSIASSPDVEKKTLYIPNKYQTICFLGNVTDGEKTSTCLCNGVPGCKGINESDENALICDAWRSGTKQNVFLVPLADIEIVVDRIVLDDHYLCVPVAQGRVELRLEGMGRATRIREW